MSDPSIRKTRPRAAHMRSCDAGVAHGFDGQSGAGVDLSRQPRRPGGHADVVVRDRGLMEGSREGLAEAPPDLSRHARMQRIAKARAVLETAAGTSDAVKHRPEMECRSPRCTTDGAGAGRPFGQGTSEQGASEQGASGQGASAQGTSAQGTTDDPAPQGRRTVSPRLTRAQRHHAAVSRIRTVLEQVDQVQHASWEHASWKHASWEHASWEHASWACEPAVAAPREIRPLARYIAMGDPLLDAALGGGLLRGAVHELVGLRMPGPAVGMETGAGIDGREADRESFRARPRRRHDAGLRLGWMPPIGCMLSVVSAALDALDADSEAPALVAWIGSKVHPSIECAMAVPRVDASVHAALAESVVDGGYVDGGCVDGEVPASWSLHRGHTLMERSFFIHDQPEGASHGPGNPRRRGRASASLRRDRALSAPALRAWCAEQAILVGGIEVVVLDANGLEPNEWRRLQLAASSSPRAPIVLAVTAPCDGERWDSGRFHPTATRWSVEPVPPRRPASGEPCSLGIAADLQAVAGAAEGTRRFGDRVPFSAHRPQGLASVPGHERMLSPRWRMTLRAIRAASISRHAAMPAQDAGNDLVGRIESGELSVEVALPRTFMDASALQEMSASFEAVGAHDEMAHDGQRVSAVSLGDAHPWPGRVAECAPEHDAEDPWAALPAWRAMSA